MLSLDAGLLDHPNVGRDLAMKQKQILDVLRTVFRFDCEDLSDELRILHYTVLGVQHAVQREISASITAALKLIGFHPVNSGSFGGRFNLSFGTQVVTSTLNEVGAFQTVRISVCVGIWAKEPGGTEIYLYSVSPREENGDLIWSLSQKEDRLMNPSRGVTHWVAPDLCF